MKWIKRVLLAIVLIPFLLILSVILFFLVKAMINPWQKTMELPRLHQPSGFFFKDSYGIIIGHSEAENLTSAQSYATIGTSLHDRAFIYASQNGGDNWNLVFNKQNSILRQISYNSSINTLYALGHENLSTEEDTSFIIVSGDNGVNWNHLISHNIKYLGFDYSCKNTQYIWSSRQVDILNSRGLKFSVNLPQNCSMYSRIPETDNSCNLWIGCENELFKISQNGQKKVIVSKNKTRFDAVAFKQTDSSIWFIVRDDEGIETVLYKYTTDGKTEKIKTFPRYLPRDLLIAGDIVAIPFSNTKNKSFLGVEKLLLYSRDSGLSWKEDWFYPVFSRKPFFLIENKMYVNAGLQRIEKRNL